MGGIVAVEMTPPPEKLGVILLPDEVSQKLRADIGTVIASGTDDLKPGDTVLVRFGDGKEIVDFSHLDYHSPEPVKFFGIAGGNDDGSDPERIPWWDSVVSVQNHMSELGYQPTGDNIYVCRDPAPNSERGILLTDNDRTRPDTGTVKAVGPRPNHTFTDRHGIMRHLQPGDRVLFHRTGILETRFDQGLDLAIMRDLCVYAVLEDD